MISHVVFSQFPWLKTHALHVKCGATPYFRLAQWQQICRDVLAPHLWRAVSAAIGVHCVMFPRESVPKEMQFVGKNNS